ncbi:hypothetical protein MGMO_5c00200 [Methyloglobulus morosus KoM1]|uniref:Uncharacterized protein n=1 Tax=Methyloglobulus morosus KoM1 TaxID=1116472 RepID=V5E3E9_9GAMM|nr:hypothetical protein [Methyloglobulus morosus]ESS74081.1 hypothetical protein MGMO_5c00200 [Methyloglobulus morosus KoM1]
MKIDFIAHHNIQFQSIGDICSILSKKYDCNALIGQASKPSGAEVGIMLDHSVFQPSVNKKNYQYLIHMSHDLADLEVYSNEKNYLKYYNLILVPGKAHKGEAKKSLPRVHILPIGWPKLGKILSSGVTQRNTEKAIIYAPSFIGNREWVELLPILVNTGYKVLIKNHVYYDYENGLEPPKGSEIEYQESIKSLIEMEDYLKKCNFKNVEYIDRRSNLCDIFFRAQLLITDSSSASIEFLPFGCSIETGRFADPSVSAKPQSSIFCKEIKFMPFPELKKILCDYAQLEGFFERKLPKDISINNQFIYEPPIDSSSYAASIIDMFIQEWLARKNIGFSGVSLFKKVLGW